MDEEQDGSSSYGNEQYTEEDCEEGEAEMEEGYYSSSSSEKCCSKATVLLVDDIVFNMIPLEQIFNNTYGLRCDKAHDGVQEVDMYLKNMKKTCCDVRYRIILTDINMPRMDGIEAAFRIFQAQVKLRLEEPMLPEIIIVAVTAYDT